MKENEQFQTVSEETEQVPTEVIENQPQTLDLNEFKIAYVVGVNSEGNFVFDIFGQERDLINLIGVHEYAKRRVDKVYNERQMSGDAVVIEVAKMVASLTEKIDTLIQHFTPQKKSDTSL